MRKWLIAATIVMASATPALAYTPTGLPWDGPLTTLLNGLQGGLAHAMLATGIIVAGIGFTTWPAAKRRPYFASGTATIRHSKLRVRRLFWRR